MSSMPTTSGARPATPASISPASPSQAQYNLQLSESILSNGGYSIQHSDTHLWYNGTIGPPFSDTDGGATIGTGWYDPPQGPRNQVGWHMSRLAGGTREPDGLKSDGAHRDAVTLSVSGANLWDNIEISNLVSNLTLTSGTTIPVSVSFEDKTAAQGGACDSTITIGLDRDDNPYNGVFNGVSSLAANLASDSFNTSLDTSGISGAYHVYAKITNGVNTRYYYARGEAIVVAAGFTKTWIGPPTGGSWSLTANWTSAGAPSATDAVSIFASSVILDTTATTKIARARSARRRGAEPAQSQPGHRLHRLIARRDDSIAAHHRPKAPNPTGIYSDLANASAGLQTLGYAEAADVLHLTGEQTALFASTTVDATSILIRYTYSGDADLNGSVNGDDYFRITAGYASQAGGFANGDFDASGHVDADDYFLIDTTYAHQGPILAAASISAAESPLTIDPITLKRRSDLLFSDIRSPMPLDVLNLV